MYNDNILHLFISVYASQKYLILEISASRYIYELHCYVPRLEKCHFTKIWRRFHFAFVYETRSRHCLSKEGYGNLYAIWSASSVPVTLGGVAHDNSLSVARQPLEMESPPKHGADGGCSA